MTTPKQIFEEQIAAKLKKNPDLAAKINAIYKFNLSGDNGGTWVIDLKVAGGEVRTGDATADCTITMKDADFVDLTTGKLNGQQAFMMGKLKVAGNMGLAMKLQTILS